MQYVQTCAKGECYACIIGAEARACKGSIRGMMSMPHKSAFDNSLHKNAQLPNPMERLGMPSAQFAH